MLRDRSEQRKSSKIRNLPVGAQTDVCSSRSVDTAQRQERGVDTGGMGQRPVTMQASQGVQVTLGNESEQRETTERKKTHL